ncbi:MAG: hypothetical protein RSD88_06965 [Anaerovoracaceae bacterium]
MNKKKPTRRPKKEFSEKQKRKLKEEITQDVTMQILILSVAAMADELKLNNDKICRVTKRIDRYADHLWEHRVRLNEIREIIEEHTGIKFGR